MAAQRQQIQPDTGQEEQRRQNRRGAGQGVGRAARAEQAAHAGTALAHPQRAAFGALHQHKADQRHGDEKFGDKQQGLHGSWGPSGSSAALSHLGGLGKFHKSFAWNSCAKPAFTL